jgi:ABC-type dipeptide/oligopeptide/nickel transport system permease component
MPKVVSLRSYILRRLVIAIPSIFIIIIVVFMLIHIAPGDPVLYLAGEAGVSPEYIERLRREFGLDRPIYEQLWIYLTKVLRGDLGYSLIFMRSVPDLILERLPATVLLIGLAEFFASLGIILAMEAGTRVHSMIDNLLSISSIVGYSLPIFWTAQILIVIFSVNLKLFPIGGLVSLRYDYTGLRLVIDIIWHAILPVVALGLLHLTLVFRVSRSSIVDVTRENYILAARSRGIDEKTIKYNHMLRNVLIPVITIMALNFGRVIAGAVLTETVFSWPGLGRLFFWAVSTRDYPLVEGLFIFISIAVIIINLVTDVLYAIVDPRVRYT